MKKGNIVGLSLFVGLVSISTVAQATNHNLVQNGSFEQGYEGTTQTKGSSRNNLSMPEFLKPRSSGSENSIIA
jgi:hypothetical protein